MLAMVDPDKPFSTRWYATPAAQREARRVGAHFRHMIVALFRNLPDATTLRILALVILVLSSAFFVYPRTILRIETQVMDRSDLTTHAIPTVRPVHPVISTGSIGVSAGSQNGPLSAARATEGVALAPVLVATDAPSQPPLEGSLLPAYRILLMYGLPGDPTFGSLGSYDNLRLVEFMQDRAAEYQTVDPDRPIKIGVEIIASLAGTTPGADGSYVRDTSATTIYSYAEFTRNNDMLLFLDVQIGRRTVPNDVQRLQRYLLQPHVHLALDPEFAVGRTELPTVDLGSITAADIRWTQEYLAAMTIENDLPPKILMVHQFVPEMIVNKPLLRSVRGVQLVIDASLWGDPIEKTGAYTQFVTDERVEFGGIMISGTWDDPAMTAEDVINLPGAPDIVIYQ